MSPTFIDVFCEKGFFDQEQTARILKVRPTLCGSLSDHPPHASTSPRPEPSAACWVTSTGMSSTRCSLAPLQRRRGPGRYLTWSTWTMPTSRRWRQATCSACCCPPRRTCCVWHRPLRANSSTTVWVQHAFVRRWCGLRKVLTVAMGGDAHWPHRCPGCAGLRFQPERVVLVDASCHELSVRHATNDDERSARGCHHQLRR